MRLYRRRPATVEVVEFHGTNFAELDEAFGPDWMAVHPIPGDFLVNDIGAVRRLTAAEFHSLYEPVL